MFHMIMRIAASLARFVQLARAHSPAGPPCCKIVVEKAISEKFFYGTSILVFYFSRNHKNISNPGSD